MPFSSIVAAPVKFMLVVGYLNPGKKSSFSWDETVMERKKRRERNGRKDAMLEIKHGKKCGHLNRRTVLDYEEVGEIGICK